ncbi:MAG: bifunctional demethylmenaquinone methyltransferase/2-methoxy-6-polyprenyl-1,4-benzoquinol methylase UbiE [Proteobacteria bacterium]|nr:MAG: bifunctional demethylmenaquinone methyltransferase/2-methoxy-6-polyprenyl-1,4-benzoquinol methylase UbiE [Pseudomonadota bacterium]
MEAIAMTLPYAKSDSYKIFNSIAGRYDLINTVLSLGLHRIWRKELRLKLPAHNEQIVLDLATGTADVAIELIRDPRITKVVGVDMSEGMIAIGQSKLRKLQLTNRIQLQVGDAQKLTYTSDQFDAATMSFGIRNVPDVDACLREIYRVLKPGGRGLVLEFALPKSSVMRALHLFYLRKILPIVGRILSGHGTAYTYLNQTIEEFPYGENFVALMRNAGFKNANHRVLTFGIVNLYWGDKA